MEKETITIRKYVLMKNKKSKWKPEILLLLTSAIEMKMENDNQTSICLMNCSK